MASPAWTTGWFGWQKRPPHADVRGVRVNRRAAIKVKDVMVVIFSDFVEVLSIMAEQEGIAVRYSTVGVDDDDEPATEISVVDVGVHRKDLPN